MHTFEPIIDHLYNIYTYLLHFTYVVLTTYALHAFFISQEYIYRIHTLRLLIVLHGM